MRTIVEEVISTKKCWILHSNIDEIILDPDDYSTKKLQEGTHLKNEIDAIETRIANRE